MGRSTRKNETKIVLKYSEREKGTENSPHYATLFFKERNGQRNLRKGASLISANELITMLIMSYPLFLSLPLHLD